jgi:hypothetical protein
VERNIWESEFYNNEVMRIVADYVESIKAQPKQIKAVIR